MRAGFDTVTGLPSSMEEKAAQLSWYEFDLLYLKMKWPHAAPNTRDEINEGLTAATKALLLDKPSRPTDEVLQRALHDWAFVLPGPDGREIPSEFVTVLKWEERVETAC